MSLHTRVAILEEQVDDLLNRPQRIDLLTVNPQADDRWSISAVLVWTLALAAMFYGLGFWNGRQPERPIEPAIEGVVEPAPDFDCWPACASAQ